MNLMKITRAELLGIWAEIKVIEDAYDDYVPLLHSDRVIREAIKNIKDKIQAVVGQLEQEQNA